MAEGRRMKVECAGGVFGTDGIEMLFQHARKAVERICRQSAFGGKRTYPVECAVQNAVSVDYKKLFHLSVLSLRVIGAYMHVLIFFRARCIIVP